MIADIFVMIIFIIIYSIGSLVEYVNRPAQKNKEETKKEVKKDTKKDELDLSFTID